MYWARVVLGACGIVAAHVYLWPTGQILLGLLIDGAAVALVISARRQRRGHERDS